MSARQTQGTLLQRRGQSCSRHLPRTDSTQPACSSHWDGHLSYGVWDRHGVFRTLPPVPAQQPGWLCQSRAPHLPGMPLG